MECFTKGVIFTHGQIFCGLAVNARRTVLLLTDESALAGRVR